MPETVCRECSESFSRTSKQAAKGLRVCPACRRTYFRAYRQKRKDAGNPVVSAQMPREYHQKYQVEYIERPGVREQRAKNQRQRNQIPLVRQKAKARRLTRSAIERGELVRQPCEVCSTTRVEAHHDDYADPLAVRWLCRQCHSDFHAKAKGESQ